MSHHWDTIGEGEEASHVLTVDGERVAAIWFLSGHVERPDAWHITFRPSTKLAIGGVPSFETIDEAKSYVENEFGIARRPPEDEVVMYLVARKDLKMSPGKLAAQCGHAVQYILQIINLPENRSWYTDWRFGDHTKIVLAVNSSEELEALAAKLDVRARVVVDRGRTEIPANTKTVLAMAPMPKSVAKPFIGHLPLYR